MLNAMMNLLDTHDDKWGESSGDERYEVTLPDGDVEQVRGQGVEAGAAPGDPGVAADADEGQSGQHQTDDVERR